MKRLRRGRKVIDRHATVAGQDARTRLGPAMAQAIPCGRSREFCAIASRNPVAGGHHRGAPLNTNRGGNCLPRSSDHDKRVSRCWTLSTSFRFALPFTHIGGIHGEGRVRLGTSDPKCFPSTQATCAVRSFTLPDRPRWLQGRVERSSMPEWMRTTCGPKRLG